jgi:hypothetical protein
LWTDSGDGDRSDTSWKEGVGAVYADDLDGIMEAYTGGNLDRQGAIFRLTEEYGYRRGKAVKIMDAWIATH